MSVQRPARRKANGCAPYLVQPSVYGTVQYSTYEMWKGENSKYRKFGSHPHLGEGVLPSKAPKLISSQLTMLYSTRYHQVRYCMSSRRRRSIERVSRRQDRIKDYYYFAAISKRQHGYKGRIHLLVSISSIFSKVVRNATGRAGWC
jgi:hypothetical protein